MAMSTLADPGDSDWVMQDETCASTASATDIAPTQSAAFGEDSEWRWRGGTAI